MIVDIENHVSLYEIIKGLLPSELLRYSKIYIQEHTYIKSRDLAYSYLSDYYHYYHSTQPSLEDNKVCSMLSSRFSQTLSKLLKEHLIEKYTTKVYKRRK